MRNISERPTSHVVDKQQNEHEECGAQAQNEAISDNGEIVCDTGPVHDTHVVNTVEDVNGNSMAACKSKMVRGRPKGSGRGKSEHAVGWKAKCRKASECSEHSRMLLKNKIKWHL